MGTCWNCNTEVSLEGDQTRCDNCGEVIYYKCNSCKEEFKVEDKKTKKKLEICPFCGFFKCPNCDVCYFGCQRFEWQKEILKILREEIPINQYPNLPDKAFKIVKFIENEKNSIERRNCPERGVPISYAKNRIKSLLARFEGYRVKNSNDKGAFVKRFEQITKREIGEELTVNQSREEGSYGQEYRDAFNLAVCMGKFKIIKKKKKDSDETYDVFVRCEREPCKHLARENLVISVCPNCKKRYSQDKQYCDNCPPYKKGKKKGQLRELKKRLNNKDTCQIYRGYFVKN